MLQLDKGFSDDALTLLASIANRLTKTDIWKKKLNTRAVAAYRANALTTGMSDRLPMKKHAISAKEVMKIEGPILPKIRPIKSGIGSYSLMSIC